MSEQNELEFVDPIGAYRRDATTIVSQWLEHFDETESNLIRGFWSSAQYGPRQLGKFNANTARVLANCRAKSRLSEQFGATRLDPSLPSSAEDREFLAGQRFKTQLMSALRTAQLALREKNEITQQNHTLTETVHCLAKTEYILTSCLAARNDARVCLHEHYSGAVSEIVGEQIVVVYEVEDGEPMKQVYDRKQFVADRVPREGDELCAYVFIAHHPSARSLPERSTKSEPDFSGFDKGVTGDAEI